MSEKNTLTREDAKAAAAQVLVSLDAQIGGQWPEADETGVHELLSAIEVLSQGRYSSARDNFIEVMTDGDADRAQAAGRGPFGPFMMASLRLFLCGKPEVSADINRALDEAKSLNAMLGSPTGSGIAAGATATVMVAVAPFLPPVLAGAAVPLVGMVSLLLMLSGLHAFCAWSEPLPKTEPKIIEGDLVTAEGQLPGSDGIPPVPVAASTDDETAVRAAAGMSVPPSGSNG